MAKGKQAAALFEVISKSKRYQRPVETRASGPSWWPFGRRKAPKAIVPAKALNAPVMSQASAASTRSVASQPVPVIPVQAELMDESHDTACASATASTPRNWDDAPQTATTTPLPGVEDTLHKPLEYAVDPERKVIAFRMSYTVAIVGGFAILVAVGLAVVVGQHLRGETAPLLAPSIASLQNGPANRAVLDVPRRTPIAAGFTPVRLTDGAAPASSQQLPPAHAAKPTFNEPRPTNFSANDGKRYIGLNYVIVQMYAATEEKMAQDASDFLNKNGVPTTIEKGLKGWPPSAFIVVGTRGFDRISTAPFKEYIAQIEKLSTQYAGTTRSYKAFQPSPKKWDKQG